MKCPFYSVNSPKAPQMKCNHFHSGREWIEFESRDELNRWKERYCNGDPAGCRYFNDNFGRDTRFEDVWLAIVTVRGRDYWRRFTDEGNLNKTVQHIIARVPLFDLDNSSYTMADLQLRVAVVHSSDPGFNALFDDLQFSGCQM
jgi:hypothetical protein